MFILTIPSSSFIFKVKNIKFSVYNIFLVIYNIFLVILNIFLSNHRHSMQYITWRHYTLSPIFPEEWRMLTKVKDIIYLAYKGRNYATMQSSRMSDLSSHILTSNFNITQSHVE